MVDTLYLVMKSLGPDVACREPLIFFTTSPSGGRKTSILSCTKVITPIDSIKDLHTRFRIKLCNTRISNAKFLNYA